jgi:carboxymethylenebutenolidase
LEDALDQRIIDLYDRFTHGHIKRRTFIQRAAAITGSAAAAAALLPLLGSNYAQAAIVASDDPRLAIDSISYDGPKGKIAGYLARPKAKGKRAAIIVIHQNRGLNPHIRDVARRFAVDGYLCLAPDLLSVAGGSPADDNDDKARELHVTANKDDMAAAAVSAVRFLKTHAESNGKVGTVGFCFGGGVVNLMAINSPDLDAAVAYYGPVPASLDKVAQIKAPLLLHYAGNDSFVNPKVPEYEAALKAANKRYTKFVYEGAQHAFTDDTAGPRYDKAAAELAWTRTLAFFRENLR